MDRITKSAHFIPIKITYSAEHYSILYINEILKLHGDSLCIISCKGTQFTSNFWKGFQSGIGTKVKLSTAFHPKTDGEAQRLIQAFDDILRACIIDLKGNWDENLPLIEFSNNNNYHSTISVAPFEELYERRCRSQVRW